MISLEGITVDPGKVRDVLDWKPRKSIHQVWSFLSLAGYYQRFISNFSNISKPITELLKKGNKYVWSNECDEAFQTMKKLVTTSPMLALPYITKPFDIYCDASNIGVTPSFWAKTECIPLCVPGLSFTHKATNSGINSITSVYYIGSYYKNLLQVQEGLSSG
jgi:hypothetical protein